MFDHYVREHFEDGGVVKPPKNTVKAYKLFRTNPRKPGQLFPLFVDADTPVPIGKWIAAKAGDPGKDPTKVKSKLGDLAYRPGWHSGDLPVATHIGGKSSRDLKAPDYRPDNQVWAEVEHPDDVDWQSVANARMEYTKDGRPKPATAHITDQVPAGGHYRYKTNPNMTGNWIISGGMKVNRVLSDDEVQSINDAAGVSDLPRLKKAGGGEVEGEGITAYHGSPHDFEQFDTSKIGTGEGAQAYGHGLYFAQNEGVAKDYRNRLANEEPSKGGTLADAFALDHRQHAMMDQNDLDDHFNDIENNSVEKVFKNGKTTHIFEDGSALIDEGDHLRPVQKQKGHMYEVHIDAHPDHFLDWDAPISEQHPDVWQKLVRGPSFIKDVVKDGIANEKTYGDIHGAIVAKHPRGQQGVSEHMAEMGIPGIRYLDASSRGQTDEPTHNYVVFNHDHVNVRRKYEQGGVV